MALGKPAIATGYSGNLAFMDADSSYLVPYALTELEQEVGPYPAGTVWAEPDLDVAAADAGGRRGSGAGPGARRAGPGRGRRASSRSSGRRRSWPPACPSSSASPTSGRRARRRGRACAGYLADGPEPVRWDAPSRSGPLRPDLPAPLLLRLLRPYLVRQRELETLLSVGIEELERSRDRLEDLRCRALHAERARPSAARRTGGGALPGALHAPRPAGRPRTAPTRASRMSSAARRNGFGGCSSPTSTLLRDHAPVLDVGCGRGELLSLLREAGVEARGVDTDEGMVDRASGSAWTSSTTTGSPISTGWRQRASAA